MHKITEEAYIAKMLPHLLPKRARKLGVTKKQRTAWKQLAKAIKIELHERYSSVVEKVIIEDMSFNDKPLPVAPKAMNYNANDFIVEKLSNIPASKRDWVKNARLELLSRARQDETELHGILGQYRIKAYQKMPFEVNGKLYFANLFLPEFGIIIEIIKDSAGKHGYQHSAMDRLSKLRSVGHDVIVVKSEDIHSKECMKQVLKKTVRHNTFS